MSRNNVDSNGNENDKYNQEFFAIKSIFSHYKLMSYWMTLIQTTTKLNNNKQTKLKKKQTNSFIHLIIGFVTLIRELGTNEKNKK